LTLKFQNQEIDICGSETEKLYDKNKKKWEIQDINFSNITKKKIFGIIVPVIPKEELIEYKSKILRSVDKRNLRYLINMDKKCNKYRQKKQTFKQ